MADDDVLNERFPGPDITPDEFERWVAQALDVAGAGKDALTVTLHDRVTAPDGTYDFDATVRFRVAGMDFLVLAEAKLHKDPIKRELVQVLHQKMQSAGAQKAVLISTAPFQRGALVFASAHGIALVQVVEGRFAFVRRAEGMGAPSRAEARSMGIPDYVGLALSEGTTPRSYGVLVLTFDSADDRAAALLDIAEDRT